MNLMKRCGQVNMITLNNYFNNTKGIFKGCKIPKRKPDYKSKNRDGRISSMYWYGKDSVGEYVIRYSNHWVKKYEMNTGHRYGSDCKFIASCFWSIKSNDYKGSLACGKIYLKDFKMVVFRNV